MTSHHCDCDHAGAEEHVKDERQEREERNSSQAAGQDRREDCVEYCGARDALNCLLPLWNVTVAVGQHREELCLRVSVVQGFAH